MKDVLLSRIQALYHHYQAIVENRLILQQRVLVRYSKKTLGDLYRLFSAPPDSSLINALQEYLQQHWGLIKGTLVCYTAIPQHDVTLLICDVAEWVISEKNKGLTNSDKPYGIVQVLMPSVHTTSVSNDYPSLGPEEIAEGQWINSLVDIKSVIQTHILGRDATYLIPVKQCTQIQVDAHHNRLINPYFDYELHNSDQAFLDVADVERLMSHSAATRALYDAKTHYEYLLTDQSNLLGHLHQLCRLLYFNSAHGGIGEQANAGAGTYQAIILFNNYYQQLCETDKSNIPLPLRDEITFLLDLAGNPEKNRNATTTIGTCIGMRRERLAPMLVMHEKTLATIGVQADNKAFLLEHAQSTFLACKSYLLDQFIEGKYSTGQD